MNKSEVRRELLDILMSKNSMSLQVDIGRMGDECSLLNDVALDSIQMLELIVEIEKRFKFSVNIEEIKIDMFDRFADLVDYVHRCAGERSA